MSQQSSFPFLSIIIPAFNEERRLALTLNETVKYLDSQSFDYEICVVENGSTDNTFQIATDFAEKHKKIRVIHEAKPGKGLAIRRGMLETSGEYRFMCDADLSMPISEVNRFLPPELDDYDIAIGSREAPGAVRYNEPQYRHLGGRLINFFIRTLLLPEYHDTQAGFKCFHKHVIEDLFNQQTMDGWSFDIEILYIAHRKGYRIIEVPIPWYFNPETKLNPLTDAIKMLIDILRIKYSIN